MKIVENPAPAIPELDPMFVNVAGYRQPLEQPVRSIQLPDNQTMRLPNENAKK